MKMRVLMVVVCSMVLSGVGLAQMEPKAGEPLLSPAATAEATLSGKAIKISYNSPRLKGRTIGADVVPYGEVWRTGANPATTLVTAAHLKIGTLDVPAGTYTIYTLPKAAGWLLIVNKQNGQWGTEYHPEQDLGRTPMTGKPVAQSQENMSISFEKTHGASTKLHVRWGKTDESVTVRAQ